MNLLQWASQSAAGALLGFAGTLLNDDRIARRLDALGPHLERLQGELWVQAMREFDLDVRRLRGDVTSMVLEGEYPADEGPGTDARAAYGYGGVEGCKQFRVGELWTADGGVLLYQLRQDGNQADVGTILTALTARRALRHRPPPHAGPQYKPCTRDRLEIVRLSCRRTETALRTKQDPAHMEAVRADLETLEPVFSRIEPQRKRAKYHDQVQHSYPELGTLKRAVETVLTQRALELWRDHAKTFHQFRRTP